MSVAPAPYSRSYSFTDFSVASPTIQQPGTQIDAQLDAVALTTASLVSRLAEIQREDGAVRNGVVGLDALSEAAKRGLSAPTAWTPSTAYRVGDLVIVVADAFLYYCSIAHTSGGSIDYANWVELGFLPGIDGTNIFSASIPYSAFTAGAIASMIAATKAAMPAGSVVQQKYAAMSLQTTCTTYIPFDTSPPQSSEGDQCLSLSITPLYSNNLIRARVHVGGLFTAVASGGTREFIAAIFRGADASAFTAGYAQIKNVGAGANDQFCQATACGDIATGGVAAVTFSVRCGSSGTQSIAVGPGAGLLGAVTNGDSGNYLILEEIKQ